MVITTEGCAMCVQRATEGFTGRFNKDIRNSPAHRSTLMSFIQTRESIPFDQVCDIALVQYLSGLNAESCAVSDSMVPRWALLE